MRRVVTIVAACVVVAGGVTLAAQNPPRPRPFPGATPPAAAAPEQTADIDPELGVPIYPGSELLGRFDAGPNQPFYLYGTASTYANVVEYYKGMLKDRGRQLFDGPMHQFDLGRYRRETMTLQPALTVKDFTWNGRAGYVHVKDGQVVTYPTVIQVVPFK